VNDEVREMYESERERRDQGKTKKINYIGINNYIKHNITILPHQLSCPHLLGLTIWKKPETHKNLKKIKNMITIKKKCMCVSVCSSTPSSICSVRQRPATHLYLLTICVIC